jgi:hypothetical protein
MSFDLDDDERRVVLKALVERAGRLIELVEDTTQASAARRIARRELILMASASGKLMKRPNRRKPA